MVLLFIVCLNNAVVLFGCEVCCDIVGFLIKIWLFLFMLIMDGVKYLLNLFGINCAVLFF